MDSFAVELFQRIEQLRVELLVSVTDVDRLQSTTMFTLVFALALSLVVFHLMRRVNALEQHIEDMFEASEEHWQAVTDYEMREIASMCVRVSAERQERETYRKAHGIGRRDFFGAILRMKKAA